MLSHCVHGVMLAFVCAARACHRSAKLSLLSVVSLLPDHGNGDKWGKELFMQAVQATIRDWGGWRYQPMPPCEGLQCQSMGPIKYFHVVPIPINTPWGLTINTLSHCQHPKTSGVDIGYVRGPPLTPRGGPNDHVPAPHNLAPITQRHVASQPTPYHTFPGQNNIAAL